MAELQESEAINLSPSHKVDNFNSIPIRNRMRRPLLFLQNPAVVFNRYALGRQLQRVNQLRDGPSFHQLLFFSVK
jgi:hypothetical protein